MERNTPNSNEAMDAIKKAIEIRGIWMQALMGKMSKADLEEKGIHFISVAE